MKDHISNKRVKIAKYELLCKQLPVILVGTLFAAVALVAALQNRVVSISLYYWFSVMLVVLLIRTLLLHWHNSTPTSKENIDSRVRHIAIASLATGLTWGVLGYLLVTSDNPLVSLIMIMGLTGLVASATVAVSSLLVVYLPYVLTALLPAAYKFYSFGQSDYYWIATLICFYLAITIVFSVSIRRTLEESINLRYENLDLVTNLTVEKHKAEEALVRAERTNFAKSRFLAAASHDLRQPMHALRLFTATLEMQTRDSRHVTVVSNINASVKALEELFNSLLDISKLDAGTLIVKKEHAHLQHITEIVGRDFQVLANEKGLGWKAEIDNETVYTDVILFERLLGNLLSNAVRYTNYGCITLSTRSDDCCIYLAVQDTGKGISEDDHQRIYEEFVQIDNPERDRSRGIGLGLSIVERTAGLLGIEVSLSSSPGVGSTFTIQVSKGDSSLVRLHSTTESSVVDIEGMLVFVVDDEQAVRAALTGLLEQWGCVVLAASSADNACQILREFQFPPDVLIVDYRLRADETGLQAIGAIQTMYQSEIPALIMTGDIAPDRLSELTTAGYRVLHKPCDPQLLKEFLQSEFRVI